MAKTPQTGESESKTALFAAIIGNLLIAVTKFIAAAFTGSSAMLSEGIHSVVDTGNGLLMLYGLRKSAKPPDKAHPFGHGRELYFWSFVVAISIFAVGGGVSVYEGVSHLRHPVEIENPFWNYVVLGFSVLFEGISWGLRLEGVQQIEKRQRRFRGDSRQQRPDEFYGCFRRFDRTCRFGDRVSRRIFRAIFRFAVSRRCCFDFDRRAFVSRRAAARL